MGVLDFIDFFRWVSLISFVFDFFLPPWIFSIYIQGYATNHPRIMKSYSNKSVRKSGASSLRGGPPHMLGARPLRCKLEK